MIEGQFVRSKASGNVYIVDSVVGDIVHISEARGTNPTSWPINKKILEAEYELDAGFQKMQAVAAVDPDIVFADGFESCLIGYAQVFNTVVAVYDRAMCIDQLVKDGSTPEEAEEYFDMNVVGAYIGERTPAFFTRVESAPPDFDDGRSAWTGQ